MLGFIFGIEIIDSVNADTKLTNPYLRQDAVRHSIKLAASVTSYTNLGFDRTYFNCITDIEFANDQ